MATDNYPIQIPQTFCSVGTGLQKTFFKTPSTCFEAKDPTPLESLLIATLYAEGMQKIADDVYPEEVHSVSKVFQPYDEPLYPIPVGASVFYIVMIAWVTCFYFTYLGRKFLVNVKQKLDLHPESTRFPNLPLYWIQQSKREAELRREVRNTWAWLARRYLLSPNDPLLDNVDQVLGLVNWHDFEVSRTTWSLVKVILTVNALYVKVKKKEDGRRKLEIIRDINLAKRKSMEDDPVQITRVFLESDEEDEKRAEHIPKKIAKERDKGLTFAPPEKLTKTSAGSSKEKLKPSERKSILMTGKSKFGGSSGGSSRKPSPVVSTMDTTPHKAPVPHTKITMKHVEAAKTKPKPAPPPPPPKTTHRPISPTPVVAAAGTRKHKKEKPHSSERETTPTSLENGGGTGGATDTSRPDLTTTEDDADSTGGDRGATSTDQFVTTDDEDKNHEMRRKRRKRRRRRKKKAEGERQWLYFYHADKKK